MDLPLVILLSRIQFAFTLAFHILFPTITIGLAAFIVIWEIQWLRTKKVQYYQLCRFWTKIFALAFGMGVVSGIVLSYQFGTNFSLFSQRTGNILGPIMSYEVLTAFFLEAGFLGIMLFGWKRVSPTTHFVATILVAIGTIISAFWIISANSWMHTPQGYRIENDIFFVGNWKKIIFNPSFPYRLFHMLFASFLTTAFFIAGISAWYLRKERYQPTAQKAFSLALGLALIIAPIQILIGDLHGLNTLKYQPIKIAALEAHWNTEKGAPLILFAIPDQKNETNHFTIEIPRLGSLILTHQWNGEIKGLKTVSPKDRPNVTLIFFTFRIMVGIGLWLLTLALIGQYLRYKGTLYTTKWFQLICTYSAPLGFIGVIAGWITTEVGRQPWLVYNLMRTSEGASLLNLTEVAITLFGFLGLYLFLVYIFIHYLKKVIHKGFEDIVITDTPDHLTAWLEQKP